MDCDEIKDFEDIIKENKEEIIRQAWANTTTFTDGVVQIGVDDGKLYCASFTTNEVENPNNRVVEVYRMESGFDAEECAECVFCDHSDDGCCCNEEQLDECVMACLMDEFDYGFDDIMSAVYGEIEECGYDL